MQEEAGGQKKSSSISTFFVGSSRERVCGLGGREKRRKRIILAYIRGKEEWERDKKNRAFASRRRVPPFGCVMWRDGKEWDLTRLRINFEYFFDTWFCLCGEARWLKSWEKLYRCHLRWRLLGKNTLYTAPQISKTERNCLVSLAANSAKVPGTLLALFSLFLLSVQAPRSKDSSFSELTRKKEKESSPFVPWEKKEGPSFISQIFFLQ